MRKNLCAYCSMYSTITVCFLTTDKVCCFDCSSCNFFSFVLYLPRTGFGISWNGIYSVSAMCRLLFEQNESTVRLLVHSVV